MSGISHVHSASCFQPRNNIRPQSEPKSTVNQKKYPLKEKEKDRVSMKDREPVKEPVKELRKEPVRETPIESRRELLREPKKEKIKVSKERVKEVQVIRLGTTAQFITCPSCDQKSVCFY